VYFVWTVISSLYRDWELGRGVDQIAQESSQRRRQREEEARRRLDNGCQHDFNESVAGLPPNTCYRCGIERLRPDGPCDHVWHQAVEPIPCSYCQQCGKKFTRSGESL
jgi:hypothetical protein